MREVALGGNTTWENLQIEKHKSVRWTFLATVSLNSAPSKRGERGAKFWQGEVQNSSPISALLRWRNFRLSLSLSLSVSLSLSPSAPHAQYRKRFRASYNKASPCEYGYNVKICQTWDYPLHSRFLNSSSPLHSRFLNSASPLHSRFKQDLNKTNCIKIFTVFTETWWKGYKLWQSSRWRPFVFHDFELQTGVTSCCRD